MKKILSFVLALILVACLSFPAFATTNTENLSIQSLSTPESLTHFALSDYSEHLQFFLDSGELSGEEKEYSLGHPFTIFNVVKNTHSTCYPLLRGTEIAGIYEVFEQNNEYFASLSISFAKELQALINENRRKDISLITDGVHLQVYDGVQSKELYRLFDDGKSYQDLSQQFRMDKSVSNQKVNCSALTTSLPLNKTKIEDRDIASLRIGRNRYNLLNVKGVSQGNHPWCWAATCAAIINYLKKTHLSAYTVAHYVFPVNAEKGGSWENIKKAYNHWGLYPSQTGVISFGKVEANINAGKPMHLGLRGHSVGLIGYKQVYGAGYQDRKMLFLLEPNGGVRKTVYLDSSGNFSYSLGGGGSAWVHTREF